MTKIWDILHGYMATIVCGTYYLSRKHLEPLCKCWVNEVQQNAATHDATRILFFNQENGVA